MGILNITPDSFSDGGLFNITSRALYHAEKMLDYGADIIDIGAESTRPLSKEITLNEELSRILKIVTLLSSRGINNISVDTRKSEVARQCLSEGASWVNDTSAFSDPNMLKIASKADAIILMHSKGSQCVAKKDKIFYDDISLQVKDFFQKKIKIANKHNIPKEKILIDPGIGFGKSFKHNLTITKDINFFSNMASGIVYGPSRKNFLGKITGIKKASNRDIATLGAVAFSATKKVNIVRVHNVKATVDMLKVFEAFRD